MGTREQVGEQLARYRDELGMNLLVGRPQIGGASQEEQEASMRIMIEEIVPALQ